MRVLMVIPSYWPIVGGAEIQLAGLVNELISIGISPVVVTRRVDKLKCYDQVDNAHVYRLQSSVPPLGFMISLASFLVRKRADYDIIHVHTLNSPLIVALFFGWVLGKPVLAKVTRSGRNTQLSKWQKGFLRRTIWSIICSRLSRFVAITEDVHRELLNAGAPERLIVRIPNGVRTSQRKYSEVSGSGDFIYVGRLIPRKRVELLVRAWARVQHKVGSRLMIIGDGPQSYMLLDLIEKMNLCDSVKLLGQYPHDKVIEYLDRAKIFVLPSESEGMSNALLEAMGMGLAVIAARIDANTAVIREGRDGLLFGHEDELVELMQKIILDSGFRDELGRHAYERAEADFSFKSIGESYKSLYAELLDD